MVLGRLVAFSFTLAGCAFPVDEFTAPVDAKVPTDTSVAHDSAAPPPDTMKPPDAMMPDTKMTVPDAKPPTCVCVFCPGSSHKCKNYYPPDCGPKDGPC